MPIIPITALPRAMAPTVFMTNSIPTSSLQSDPRFQYAAFIPDTHYPSHSDTTTKLPVLVTIHGTSRTHLRYMNIWQDFATTHRCAIIAPLFPTMVSGPLDIDGYHYLGQPPAMDPRMTGKLLKAAIAVPGEQPSQVNPSTKVRHDLVLLQMLDEVSLRWPALDTSKFLLAGFSGGAQFAHLFLCLHAERLLAVSIGAPGRLTALDPQRDWPEGVGNVRDVFEKDVDVEAIKKVAVLACVGAEDGGVSDGAGGKAKARLEVKGEVYGSEEKIGLTRVDRLREMVDEWKQVPLDVEFQVVSGAKHEMEKVHVVVEPFMVTHVQKWWQTAGQTDN